MNANPSSGSRPAKADRMTLDELPSPSTTRWIPKHKVKVVSAVHLGLLSVEEALERYHLSLEEYLYWERGGIWATKDSRSKSVAATA